MTAEQLSGHRLRDYGDAIAVLAAARTSQGLSLADVTRHTYGSRGSLSEALRGRHEIGGVRLFALAAALGFDLALVPRGPDTSPPVDRPRTVRD